MIFTFTIHNKHLPGTQTATVEIADPTLITIKLDLDGRSVSILPHAQDATIIKLTPGDAVEISATK